MLSRLSEPLEDHKTQDQSVQTLVKMSTAREAPARPTNRTQLRESQLWMEHNHNYRPLDQLTQDRLLITSAMVQSRQHHQGNSRGLRGWRAIVLSLQLLLTIVVVRLASQPGTQVEATPQVGVGLASATDQLIRRAFPHQPLSREGLAFDSSQFKSIYEAIRAHPDLREVSFWRFSPRILRENFTQTS